MNELCVEKLPVNTDSLCRDMLVQKKHEVFSVWFSAVQLRASMQRITLPDITAEEWKEYDKPTAGVFK